MPIQWHALFLPSAKAWFLCRLDNLNDRNPPANRRKRKLRLSFPGAVQGWIAGLPVVGATRERIESVPSAAQPCPWEGPMIATAASARGRFHEHEWRPAGRATAGADTSCGGRCGRTATQRPGAVHQGLVV